MRSNVTPGTSLALFCIQNLQNKKTHRDVKGWKKIKTCGLYSLNCIIYKRDNQWINTGMKNESYTHTHTSYF